MSTCAVCALPIRGRDKFVIAGSEAVHVGCAGQIEHSRYWKLRRQLDASRAEIAAAYDQAAEHMRRADHAERDIARLVDASRARDVMIESNRRQLAQFVTDLENLRADRRDAEGRANELAIRLAEVKRERDVASAELALHRTLGPAAVTAPTAETGTTEPATETNSASKRFSLIELK